eukprot:TRINITY_DN19544_c0_g1_i2.p1 TRINITY_DN19544_c0_g1~~TRINITY_DN19544_c0_g1_i2.p1  ORF type:complete len:146 (+),score=29.45 TRINITY_DN19544_c0_g1_i2:176-613(+)
MYIETTSYDTIGNAYFARVSHTDIRQWNRLLIVTSEYHMPRTQAIFDWVFSLPLHADAPKPSYDLVYANASDAGLNHLVLNARAEKEANGLQGVLRLRENIKTLRDLHEWIFSQHDMYAASRLVVAKTRSEARAPDHIVRLSYGG